MSKGAQFGRPVSLVPVLAKHRISNKVGSRRAFSSMLLRVLTEERRIALVNGVACPTVLVRNGFQVRNSVRPMHLFGHNRDRNYYFELPREA
jgi:hypothetical protein